jgi:hypothetical protein
MVGGFIMFQHHPDNLIIITVNGKAYRDTPENFTQDLCQEYEPLPEGLIERAYQPGIRHYLGTGNTAIPQPLFWEIGDFYISQIDLLLTNQSNRIKNI